MAVDTDIPKKEQLSSLPSDIPPEDVVDNVSYLWFNPVRCVLADNRIWRSRRHRKGRPLQHQQSSSFTTQPSSSVETLELGESDQALSTTQQQSQQPRFALHLWKPYNVSWWTAVLFTVGSLSWVVNGAAAFHWTDTQSTTRLSLLNASGFIGGTLFYFGGWCMYWEALNAERKAHFDITARLVESNFITSIVDLFLCKSEPLKRTEWLWIGWGEKGDGDGWRSMSFLANFSQFCGTSIFWIATWAAWFLPEDESTARGLYYGVYWTPQVIGAWFLTVSSIFLTLETQTAWWKPNLMDLGWHIGFWNILGSLGFFLSGVFGIPFGPDDETGRQWGVNFSTYLGSYFFLLGSVLQYIEICRVNEKKDDEKTDV
ncbi:hypothetical protein HDV00_007844 [Rhizophlyctis rosea]|nr:hypothetical protein HDV00_007844 [Rhizophlyctis rosea]